MTSSSLDGHQECTSPPSLLPSYTGPTHPHSSQPQGSLFSKHRALKAKHFPVRNAPPLLSPASSKDLSLDNTPQHPPSCGSRAGSSRLPPPASGISRRSSSPAKGVFEARAGSSLEQISNNPQAGGSAPEPRGKPHTAGRPQPAKANAQNHLEGLLSS